MKYPTEDTFGVFNFQDSVFDLKTEYYINKEFNGTIKGLIIDTRFRLFRIIWKYFGWGDLNISKVFSWMNTFIFKLFFVKKRQVIFKDSDQFVNFDEI